MDERKKRQQRQTLNFLQKQITRIALYHFSTTHNPVKTTHILTLSFLFRDYHCHSSYNETLVTLFSKRTCPPSSLSCSPGSPSGSTTRRPVQGWPLVRTILTFSFVFPGTINGIVPETLIQNDPSIRRVLLGATWHPCKR